MKEEPYDSNESTLTKDKQQDKRSSSSSRQLRSGNKRRLRSVVISSDDSEDECTKTNLPEQKKKAVSENKKQVKAKAKNTVPEDEDDVRKARPRRTRILSR